MTLSTIGGASCSPCTSNTDASADSQVQRLESQIKDWQTCPTTDPAVKRQMVDRLQIQLDRQKANINRAATRARESAQPAPPKQGAGLDIFV